MVYLSEDRNGEGLLSHLSIKDNLTLTRISSCWGWIRSRVEAKQAADWMLRLKIKAPDSASPVRGLSGGNQQKVLLARLLHQDPDVLLLDEPTRGVDISSKKEIYEQINQLAAGGKAILMTSSYLPELFGMTLIIISGGIDLSVGSNIALTSVVTALALRHSWPPSVALLGGIVAGGLVGLVNGLAITSLRVVPFIATLGMLGIARGAAKWAAGEQTVNVPPTWVNELAVTFPKQRWLIVAPGVWIALLLAILVAVLLQNTIFGRHVFALGSNEAAARACGIHTARLKLWIYSLAGFFFGLAGAMQLSRLRQGDPTVAVGVDPDGIAAVVIGGGSLTGGGGSIFG